MKICFLLSTFAYDGIKRSVVHFANSMQALGHEVWVGILHEWPGKVSLRSELRVPDEKVISWDGLGQGRREWEMFHFFRKQRFDVVHTNTIKMNHVGRWTALLAGVPCVFASEDNICLKRSWKTRQEDRFLARWGHGVIMISDAVKRSFIEMEGLPSQKIHTVYYGLPIDQLRSLKKSDVELSQKRKELGIQEGPTIVCAARLDPSKSIETLIQATRRLVDQNPGIQVLLAGDGSERAKLEKNRDDLNLHRNFHFLGARTDIYEILQIADVVTLCSLWEGLGFSLMEAMAFGKPLVGTDVAGINEIISHQKNGLLVAKQSAEQLSRALYQILEDPPFARRLSQGSEEVLREKFDVQKNTQQLLGLYQSCLG
jgi:glycosyltransferase involved in cell wall biosynthesis